MKQYFGIDIGGTAVKLGIVDETGKVLCKGEQSVNFDGYQTPVLDTVRKAAKEFLTAQAIPVENLSGIGVSATGQIDSRKGIVAGTCGNFPNYIGSPIKAALEQDFGLPVTVANDANCMTLGEVWVGGAQGYTDVIGVTLGTGVGGGILTGGRLLEGARGLGGELGHYRTHALDGVPCTCGAKGCWERYAATTALVRADRPGAGWHGAYLQPSIDPDRRRRERPAETAHRPHCRQSKGIGDARLCRGAGDPRRTAAQRRRYGGRRILLPPDHGRKGVIH